MLINIINTKIKQSVFTTVICVNIFVFLSAILSFYIHFNKINELEDKYQSIELETLGSLNKRKRKYEFLSEYKNSNSNYLVEFFKNKELFSEERTRLSCLNSQPFFYQNSNLKNKISELNENKFKYVIGDTIEKKNVIETSIALKHPVHCNFNDLTEILSKIDNVSINNFPKDTSAPQIIPCDIYIEINDCDFVFDCKLLQREFK